MVYKIIKAIKSGVAKEAIIVISVGVAAIPVMYFIYKFVLSIIEQWQN